MIKSKHNISIQPDYVLVERPRDYKVVLSKQKKSLLEISAVCEKAGCHRVLILGPRTKVRLSVSDIYNLGTDIANLRLQIAVVELHDASNENVTFLETVVSPRNGGHYMVGTNRHMGTS